jgi:predicted dithiol-disulfide oxidoreductase (DUF899 family)
MEKTIQNRIVSRENWLIARKQLLVKEKELTRRRDQLSAERRELPWVMITEEYVFDGPDGRVTLAGLFGNHSQLIINHFMLGPDWEEGCPGRSFGADPIESALVHLERHDVSYVAVSRAPLSEIEAFRKRMGWRFKWVSSFGSDFNYDFHVSFTKEELSKGKVYYNFAWQKIESEEMPGMSVFYKDEDGDIFQTYSAYGRGGEELVNTYMHLDLTPMGRNETGPYHDLRDWACLLQNMYLEGPIGSSCCGIGKEQW